MLNASPGDQPEAIVARADYWIHVRLSCTFILITHDCIQRGDIEQAARELNQLKGVPKQVVRDWLHDARAYLEVQQAVAVLNAYIGVLGLTLV